MPASVSLLAKLRTECHMVLRQNCSVLQQNNARKEVKLSAVVICQPSPAENTENLGDDQTNWFRSGHRWKWTDIHHSVDLALGDDLWSAALRSNTAFMSKELSEKWSHPSQCWGRTTPEQSLQLHPEKITEMSWVKPSPSFSDKKQSCKALSASENIFSSCFMEVLEIPHEPNL